MQRADETSNCKRCGVGWLPLRNAGQGSHGSFCRISIGLGVLMPSEVSTINGDQSVEALRRELAEARDHQAATSEILRVISSSPTDTQGVFEEIARSATRLCDAHDAVIRQIDGEVFRLVAHHGPIPTTP